MMLRCQTARATCPFASPSPARTHALPHNPIFRARSGVITHAAASTYNITFQMPGGKKASINCSDGQHILDAAQDAGLDLPHCCTSGTCCACAVKVLDGRVDSTDQVFLNPEQLAKGFALICSAFPRSDCTILTHQEENLHLS